MSVAGVGIHSGRACEVRLHRVDGPVHFLRNGAAIPADVSAVASTERCTTLAPERPIVAERGLSMVRWEAGPTEICARIEFDHPAIGAQTWCGGPDRWAEVLAARTFGFVSEADALLDRGLARGASVENAIVFSEEGPLRPLRTPQEPVRHKVLDLLGDLFLLGRPLAGRITATRGSHALHLDFMRSLTHLPHSARRRRP